MKRQPTANHSQSVPTVRQRGMASIIITLVTMLVISLIVLGFAAISRREQRQSLDQQLSAQAFYAAESAVEDAKKAIQLALASGQGPVGKDNCTTNNLGGNYPVGPQTILDKDNDVSYTCLKVDVAPRSATYDGVGEESIVVPIRASGPIDRIEVTWRPTTPPQGTPAACPGTVTNEFSPQSGAGAWSCGYGMLRADLVSTAGALNRPGLTGNTLAGVYMPTSNAANNGQISYGASRGQPNVVAAKCDTAAYGQCQVTIVGLGASREFSMRISSFYRTSNLSVIAYQGATPISFSGTQAVVDATGKAQDVLRRIQVRLPLKPSPGLAPNYAIQSNNAICKRFTSTSGVFNISGDIENRDRGNPMCNPITDGSPPIPPCVPNHDIMLTLDTSGSMDSTINNSNITAIDQLKAVASQFVQTTNISPTSNRVGIVRFSSDAELGVGLTSDQNQLLAYIRTLNAGGGTQYLKGLKVTVDEFNGPRARPGSPRVIIFVTDGSPSDSKDQIRATAANIKNSGVRIYTIGIELQKVTITLPGGGVIRTGGYDEQLLIDMAGNGGRYFVANNDAALKAALQGISTDLRCEP